MRFILVAAVVAGLTACGGSPIRTFTGPAPAGALQCAIQQGVELGYTPIRGGANDGYAVLELPSERDLQRVAAVIPGVRRPTDGHELNITQTSAGLRIQVYSYYQRQGLDRRREKPSGRAQEHAQQIVYTCGGPNAPAPSTN